MSEKSSKRFHYLRTVNDTPFSLFFNQQFECQVYLKFQHLCSYFHPCKQLFCVVLRHCTCPAPVGQGVFSKMIAQNHLLISLNSNN